MATQGCGASSETAISLVARVSSSLLLPRPASRAAKLSMPRSSCLSSAAALESTDTASSPCPAQWWARPWSTSTVTLPRSTRPPSCPPSSSCLSSCTALG